MKYRNLIVDGPNEPATDADIARVEEILGAELPDDYKAFLKACNGGHLDYEFPVQFEDGTEENLSLCSFHELISPGSWETNPFELENMRNMDGFPSSGVLPIARDGGSSQLFLDLRDGYRVVAFVHGLPAWTGLRQKDSLVQLAESFDDYWDRLMISDFYVQDFITNYDPKYGNPDLAAEWLDTGHPSWREKYSEIWKKHVLDAHK